MTSATTTIAPISSWSTSRGHTLRQIIKSGRGSEFTVFGSIALQILEGISEAHSLGMVHRDIKPANIMLTERRGQDNYVKILDFGLAKLVKGATDVTKEQTLVGSVSYLAPEQIMGNDTDQRVDIYALGVLFYYMLTGEKPFSGEDDVAVLYQHVHNQPERLETILGDANIPRPVLELVHRALAKDPDRRFADAGQFLDAMKRCLANSEISAPHISGEFDSITGSGVFVSGSPEDPSDQLDRERHETPIHQGSIEAGPHEHTNRVHPTPTPSGVTSEQMSWVTGEHLMKVQKQNRFRNILLGVLGAFLIGGVAVFFYMRQAKIPAEQDVRADISQAVSLIDDEKLGQAENALTMLSEDLEHHPNLKPDYLAARDKLAIAKLMSNAKIYEEDDEIEDAVEAYKKVLGRAPDHEAARTRLRALRAEQHDEEEAAVPPDSIEVGSRPAQTEPANPDPAPGGAATGGNAGRSGAKTAGKADDAHAVNAAAKDDAAKDDAAKDDSAEASPGEEAAAEKPAPKKKAAAKEAPADDTKDDQDDDLFLPDEDQEDDSGAGDLLLGDDDESDDDDGLLLD